MNKLFVPPGFETPQAEPPKTSFIIMQTADGQTVGFPQVAVAVITPDVINLIAEAIYQRLEKGAVMQPDGQYGIEMPVAAPATDMKKATQL